MSTFKKIDGGIMEKVSNKEWKIKLSIIAYIWVIAATLLLICAMIHNHGLNKTISLKDEQNVLLKADSLDQAKRHHELSKKYLEASADVLKLEISFTQSNSSLEKKERECASLTKMFNSEKIEWGKTLANRDTLLVDAYRTEASLMKLVKQLKLELNFTEEEFGDLSRANDSLVKQAETIAPLQAKLKAHIEFLEYLSKWDKNVTNFRDNYIYDGKRGVFQKNVKLKNIIK